MTIQDIQSRKEDQTFDCKSIQIDPKALATGAYMAYKLLENEKSDEISPDGLEFEEE